MKAKQDIPSPFNVGLNFTLGGAAAVLLAIVTPGNYLAMLLGSLVPTWLRQPISIFVPYLGLIVGGFAGGAIGAESLQRGIRFSLTFGAGFILPGIAVPIILTLIQRMSIREDILRILPPFVAGFTISFFLAGAIGAVFLRQGKKTILAVATGFGLGGILGGIVTACFFIFRNRFHGISGIPTLVAGWLLPYFVGGSILGSVLKKQRS